MTSLSKRPVKSPKPFYESSFSEIFLVESSIYHEILPCDCLQHVVMKTLNNDHPKPGDIKRFYNEYKILQNISHPRIRRVFARTKIKDKHTLFMEWAHGKTIRDIGKVNAKEFLFLAQQIVEAFVELHARRIVHKNVSADNILVNPDNRQIKIIDFKLASRKGVRERNLDYSYRFKSSFNYISPEQGGMMNSIVDYRSDLYSLGCIFYYMLAGELPFQSENGLEMFKKHADYYPPPLCTVDKAIPAPLSELVEKLMRKTPDERYQSAVGLLYDLKLIFSQVEFGMINFDFLPAQKDHVDRIHFSKKLYGRTKQISILLSSFDRVCNGNSEMVLVAGSSGTGKSSLVENLRKPVVKKNGYFIHGKYDQLQKSEPYSAILQAFNRLCELMLQENDETLENFQRIIQEAVGAEGKILTNVVPDLELIIGSQLHLPEVDAIETKSRFNHILRKFVKAVCAAHHPILLFIDDLQWADSASLDLLSVLVADKEIKYLLLVGAYRENEVSESHPLAIKLLNEAMQMIKVGKFSRKNIDELISDLLNTAQEDIYTLTNLVHEKTNGDPFFVIEFLKSLLDENILYFCYNEFRWKWSAEKIKGKNATQNVIDVIVTKFLKLPEETKKALKMASCLGSRFDLSTLQLIIEKEDVEEIIDEAYINGMLLQSITEDATFYFSHDRIQQAVYMMIPEPDRITTHLYIGRMLQEKLPKKRLDEMLFLVVNQLNTGLESITDKHERTHLARLNLQAGMKARLSSAFELAAKFLFTGIKMLHQNSWIENYKLSLKLHVTASEMAYFNGNFDHMNEILDQAFASVTSTLDKVKLYVIKIKALRAQNKIHETLETGLHVLKQLGEPFPAQPTLLSLTMDLSKTKLLMWNKSNDAIASMPSMKDERAIAAVSIMGEISSSARLANPKLLALITFRINRLTMKYGITKCSIFGFAWYGMINAVYLRDFEEGYRFGQLLTSLLDRFPEKRCRCWIKVLLNSNVSLRKENIRLSFEPLEDAIRLGQEAGEIEYSLVAVWRYCAYELFVGNHLLEAEEKIRNYCEQAKAHKQQHVFDMIAPYLQTVLNLMGIGSNDPAKLKGEAFDEEATRKCDLSKNVFANVAINFNCMVLAYFFHQYKVAAERAGECERIMKHIQIYEKENLHFYCGLISLAMAKQVKNDGKWINIANDKVLEMRKLAKFSPDNYLHKLYLLEAEMAAFTGCRQKATEKFSKAIHLAKSQNFMHEEALACERAGIFYYELGENELAFLFLSHACEIYQEWGAQAKVDHLQKQYPFLISSESPLLNM